jgi:hypothetical protein
MRSDPRLDYIEKLSMPYGRRKRGEGANVETPVPDPSTYAAPRLGNMRDRARSDAEEADKWGVPAMQEFVHDLGKPTVPVSRLKQLFGSI